MNPPGHNANRRNPVTDPSVALDPAASPPRRGRHHASRKHLSALGASLALLGGMLWVAPAAVADTASIRCAGTNVIKYNPGLTFEERTVQINGEDNATSCVDAVSGEAHSFVAPFSGKFTTSCASLFTGGTGTQTLNWNTGETSQWDWTMHFSTNVNGQLQSIADGPIVGGRYAGSQLRQIVTVTTMDQRACSTAKGLTETGGPSNWEFTG